MEDEGGAEKSLEVRVAAAMRARLNDFKDKADTLTLEGVRRVLEKDLGLKTMELDSHKKFIKQCMDKHFYAPTESAKTLEENPVETSQSENIAEMPKKFGSAESEFEGIKELSSVTKDAKKKLKDIRSVNLDEGVIKKAIQKRAKYFQENSGNITMAGVRRLLEEDLKFERKSLDKYKDFISKQLDQIFSEVVEPSNGTNKNKSKKSAALQGGKGNKKPENTSGSDDSANSEEISDSAETDIGSDDSGSEEVEVKKRKKRNARERKEVSAPVQKRQKISSKTSGLSTSGRKKSEEHDMGSDSEDNLSDSTMEGSSKKKSENPTPIYGKEVEHLKSVIKACGMSVPPSVYKRAKQAPDNKRESFLIKELEGILEKEGLSRNPSEKDIKAVRKNKERAKDLEGIDLSNIVSSSRRRTTASFVPPKPQIPLDESEEEEEEEDEDDTDDENSQSGGELSEGSEEEEEEASD